MEPYEYKSNLDFSDNSPYAAEIDADGRRLLRTVMDVTIAAHAGQSRNKIDPSIGYITHQIMVFEMLWRMGERDPLTLAGGLLHDSLEDGSKFHQRTWHMLTELRERLTCAGYPPDRISPDAHALVKLCLRVTNPVEFKESKEIDQIERVRRMNIDAKKIKIADQAASLVCNLTMQNDPKSFWPEAEKRFTYKARALVTAIVRSASEQERAEITRYGSMFGHTYNAVMPLLACYDSDPTTCAHDQQMIRDAFSFSQIFDRSPVAIVPHYEQVSTWLDLSSESPQVTAGLARVGFNRQGDIIRYVMWAEPQRSEFDPTNRAQQRFLGKLREKANMSPTAWRTTEGLIESKSAEMLGHDEQGNLRFGREYSISPAMPAAAYASALRELSDTREVATEIAEKGLSIKGQIEVRGREESHAEAEEKRRAMKKPPSWARPWS